MLLLLFIQLKYSIVYINDSERIKNILQKLFFSFYPLFCVSAKCQLFSGLSQTNEHKLFYDLGAL